VKFIWSKSDVTAQDKRRRWSNNWK